MISIFYFLFINCVKFSLFFQIKISSYSLTLSLHRRVLCENSEASILFCSLSIQILYLSNHTDITKWKKLQSK